MTDQEQVAPEATPEVVPSEAEQVSAPEAAESTEGQISDQPAEVTEQEPEAEEVSASKARRERRKAEMDRLREIARRSQADKERVESQLAELRQAQTQEPPKVEDYVDYEDYVAAKNAHASLKLYDQREIQRLERAAEEQERQAGELQQVRFAEAQNNWAAQSDEARQRYADFDAVVTAPDVPVTDAMAAMLAMSDNGADIAYFLGMNKDEAGRIASMSPPEQAGAMRMLERFVPRQMPKPRTQSNAPDPVAPVKPKATGTKSPDNMSMAEYAAARKAGKL